LRYAYKRIARVYPAYWVYLSGFILAAAVGFGHPDFSWNPWNLASSYLLVPLIDDVTLPLKVAWTLVYEMRFYAIFIVLLIFGWTALWAFAAWGVAILFLFLSGIGGPDVLSLWNLYFLAGMVGYLVLDRIPPRYGLAILAGGVVLFVIYALLAHDVFRIRDLSQSRPELHLVLAPAFLALILGAVLIERNYDMRYPNFLMLLGDASYSIYLVHSAAISACILISAKLGLIEMMGHYLFFAFAFLFSVFVGVAAYLLVEKPLIGLSRRIWK
jgi:peptidoglycan/LPS O-acetylase OafA/YrhL